MIWNQVPSGWTHVTFQKIEPRHCCATPVLEQFPLWCRRFLDLPVSSHRCANTASASSLRRDKKRSRPGPPMSRSQVVAFSLLKVPDLLCTNMYAIHADMLKIDGATIRQSTCVPQQAYPMCVMLCNAERSHVPSLPAATIGATAWSIPITFSSTLSSSSSIRFAVFPAKFLTVQWVQRKEFFRKSCNHPYGAGARNIIKYRAPKTNSTRRTIEQNPWCTQVVIHVWICWSTTKFPHSQTASNNHMVACGFGRSVTNVRDQ